MMQKKVESKLNALYFSKYLENIEIIFISFERAYFKLSNFVLFIMIKI